MFKLTQRHSFLTYSSAALVGLVLFLALAANSISLAQEQPAYLRFVRHVQADDLGG